MNERLIHVQGAEERRRQFCRRLASARSRLNAWAGTLAPDFERLKSKIARSSIPLGISLLDDKLYDNLTVGENLHLMSRLSGTSSASIAGLSEVFELSEHIKRFFGKLDAPLQHRVQLAASLVSNPELVIWEEPDLGDSEFLARLFDWLEENEIDAVFSAPEPPDGVACRTINAEGEQ